ncbi:hypothetical protein JKP88DRAFT_267938 [Tribonema minus]|uniref:RNB domain-containing protein n=1 Tax=Tribonema minus TaxID=303371 RepID=A0A835Z4Y9_9STRA|nr:hypothetical protein JKP88DRAFT_267938 [Tribonema minus]
MVVVAKWVVAAAVVSCSLCGLCAGFAQLSSSSSCGIGDAWSGSSRQLSGAFCGGRLRCHAAVAQNHCSWRRRRTLHMAAFDIEPGCLIMFERNSGDQAVLGLVTERDGKRNFLVEGPTGKLSVAPKAVRYVLPGGASYTSQQRHGLASAATNSAQEDEETLVHTAWELLVEDPDLLEGPLTPGAFAELALGGSTPQDCLAAFGLLTGEWGRLYFKAKGDGAYEARAGYLVDELVRKRDAEAAEEARRDALRRRLQDLLNAGAGRALSPAVVPGVNAEEGAAASLPDAEGALSEADVAALRSLAAMAGRCMGRDPPHPDEVDGGALLSRLARLPTRANAFRLCVQLGILDDHANLFLRGTDFERGASEAAAAEALSAAADGDGGEDPDAAVRVDLTRLKAYAIDSADTTEDPDAAVRVDLTRLKAYAIDSADTTEVDDAVSVERLPNGRERVWVHIADVSRWVQQGSALDQDAARRQTTLYLPEQSVPMFPRDLAENVLSLTAGRPCPALSMGVILNDAGAIEDLTVVASTIVVTYRLTYEHVDEMLYDKYIHTDEAHAVTSLSRHIYTVFHKRPVSEANDCRGDIKPAFQMLTRSTLSKHAHSKHVVPDAAAEDGRGIVVSLDDPDRSSVQLVTELMIMSGEGMARLGREQGIGMPFRCQRAPASPPDEGYLEQFPARYCRAVASYRFMSGAIVSAEPGIHWGLGLDGYVQWSSPIRRFNDLVVHWQVKRWLHGQTPLSGADVAKLVASQEGTLQAANKIARDSSRYWLIEYLRRTADEPHVAYVLGYNDNRERGGKVIYDILLEELGAVVKHPETSITMEPGDALRVTVAQAAPRSMTLRLRCAKVSAERCLYQIAVPPYDGEGGSVTLRLRCAKVSAEAAPRSMTLRLRCTKVSAEGCVVSAHNMNATPIMTVAQAAPRSMTLRLRCAKVSAERSSSSTTSAAHTGLGAPSANFSTNAADGNTYGNRAAGGSAPRPPSTSSCNPT